jgi:hypothetical protein
VVTPAVASEGHHGGHGDGLQDQQAAVAGARELVEGADLAVALHDAGRHDGDHGAEGQGREPSGGRQRIGRGGGVAGRGVAGRGVAGRGAVGFEIGGIVLPRSGSAVDIRTCCGSTYCDEVECGARRAGSGATSPAPRSGGTVSVRRGAVGRDGRDGGAENRSAAGSRTGPPSPLFTWLMSAFTAVDSVLAIFRAPSVARANNRESHSHLQPKSPDEW